MSYLPSGLPIPVPENDGLDKPYWDATRKGELVCSAAKACGTFQWGPEWICHKCLSFDMGWHKVSGKGSIYSWERPWHPVHPALKGHGPRRGAGRAARRRQRAHAGQPVRRSPPGGADRCQRRSGVRAHDDAKPPFTLVQWKVAWGASSPSGQGGIFIPSLSGGGHE